MTQYGFFVNSSICTGCRTCQVACQDKNDLAAEILWRRVYDYGGGSWVDSGNGTLVPEGVFRYFLSAACNHCEVPACVESCPTGAMQKDDETGIVWSDHEVCIACESCVSACPYGAPVLDAVNGYVTKCDMCRDQISEGGKPECVLSCPMRALDWGAFEELADTYPDAVVGDVEPLPVPATGPRVLIGAHSKAQKSGQGAGRILNMEEEL